MIDRILDWLERNYLRAAVLILAVLVLMVISAMFAISRAADVTVTWSHPTERVDGSPLAVSEIRETVIEYLRCGASGAWASPASLAVPAPAATAIVPGLGSGRWCFRLRTVDTLGLASELSSPAATKTITATPKAPAGVSVN